MTKISFSHEIQIVCFLRDTILANKFKWIVNSFIAENGLPKWLIDVVVHNLLSGIANQFLRIANSIKGVIGGSTSNTVLR